MVNVLGGLMRKLTGRCPDCGSDNLEARAEVVVFYREEEIFPKGCLLSAYEVKIEKRTRYCLSCDYKKYLGEYTSRTQIA
ncbi:MAG: hypothetical protein AABX73_00735 [Nanoarchaeota archaeon]